MKPKVKNMLEKRILLFISVHGTNNKNMLEKQISLFVSVHETQSKKHVRKTDFTIHFSPWNPQ
jgi:hypothetical protein